MELLNKIDETLLRNIRLEMESLGWNQSELARKVGKDRARISRLFNLGSWDSDLLLSISKAFNLNPWDLLREGPDEPHEIEAEDALKSIAQKLGVKISIIAVNNDKSAIKRELELVLSTLNDTQAKDLLGAFRGESTADLMSRARDILGISNDLGKKKKN